MAKRYDFAIRLGLRSLIQLQFDGDDDAFYIAREMRRYVDGGIRTSVYDNRICCDNVQHGLMAALKFLSVSKREPDHRRTITRRRFYPTGGQPLEPYAKFRPRLFTAKCVTFSPRSSESLSHPKGSHDDLLRTTNP